MKREAFRPRKRFGQNFLSDPAIARKFIDGIKAGAGQVIVELGAGKGFLTRPLAETGARIIALELDRDLHAALSEDLASEGRCPSPVELLNVDLTEVRITDLLAERGLGACVLLGNIPYHLTRDVLFSFLVGEHGVIEAAYLMMQREVAERIVAGPGTRTYGIPSVILQSLYAVRPLFRVAAGSFVPRPKVDSMVVAFEPLEEPFLQPAELEPFGELVRNVFQQRRKTLHSTLRAFYSLDDDALARMQVMTGVDLNSRPEMLSREQFRSLCRALAHVAGPR